MNSKLDNAEKGRWSRILCKCFALAVSWGLGGHYAPAQQEVPKMPMQPKYEDGAEARWLNKKVLDWRELDFIEDASTWSVPRAGEETLADSPVQKRGHSPRHLSHPN